MVKSSTLRSRRWKEDNPERWAEQQRRYRQKLRSPCRGCGGEMPFPAPGSTYCSDDCRKAARSKQSRERHKNAQRQLAEHKLARGCDICGYDTCAAALDFHHRDPSQKTMRITARQFVADTERTQAELAKCDLLCSNCHHEVHAPPPSS